nr:DUF1836 domain-containing protein [Lentilactobacillus otakiensis]
MPKTTTELQIKLPMWEELPTFSLHLDQLLDLTNGYLEPIIGDKITKTMLHNYFKAKILVPPVKKKIPTDSARRRYCCRPVEKHLLIE